MLPAISQKMLKSASNVNDTATAPDLSGVGLLETTHVIKWETGTAAGTVEIEAADDPAYAGTWAPVATVAFSGTAPKADYVRVQGQYNALRHRISAIVQDGTVSSTLSGSV